MGSSGKSERKQLALVQTVLEATHPHTEEPELTCWTPSVEGIPCSRCGEWAVLGRPAQPGQPRSQEQQQVLGMLITHTGQLGHRGRGDPTAIWGVGASSPAGQGSDQHQQDLIVRTIGSHS